MQCNVCVDSMLLPGAVHFRICVFVCCKTFLFGDGCPDRVSVVWFAGLRLPTAAPVRIYLARIAHTNSSLFPYDPMAAEPVLTSPHCLSLSFQSSAAWASKPICSQVQGPTECFDCDFDHGDIYASFCLRVPHQLCLCFSHAAELWCCGLVASTGMSFRAGGGSQKRQRLSQLGCRPCRRHVPVRSGTFRYVSVRF